MATLIFFFMMNEATPCGRRRSTGRNWRRCDEVDPGGERVGGGGAGSVGEAAAQGAVRHALRGVSSPGGDAVARRVAVLRREAAPGRGEGALRRGRHPGPGRAEP